MRPDPDAYSKNERFIISGVKSDNYLLGIDLGNRSFLAKQLYTIEMDETTGIVGSKIISENIISVSEGKLHIINVHVKKPSTEFDNGFTKTSEKEYPNCKYIEIVWIDPTSNSVQVSKGMISNQQSEGIRNQKSNEQMNIMRASIMASSDTTVFEYANFATDFYFDYSGLFGGECAFCSNSNLNTEVFNLSQNDIKYLSNCDKLKIRSVMSQIIKYPEDLNAAISSSSTFGYLGITVIENKPAETVVTNDCINCQCKFFADLYLLYYLQLKVRSVDSMGNVLKQFFETPRIIRNAEGNYEKDGTNRFVSNRANVEAFRNTMIAHERLHCVQYRMLAEAFFRGNFPNDIRLPFYSNDPDFKDILFWDGGTKTIADKVCEALGDYSCCKISGGCETPECNKHIETLKNEIAGKTADLITKRTDSFYKEIEVPAWHYVFFLMQNYHDSQNE